MSIRDAGVPKDRLLASTEVSNTSGYAVLATAGVCVEVIMKCPVGALINPAPVGPSS